MKRKIFKKPVKVSPPYPMEADSKLCWDGVKGDAREVGVSMNITQIGDSCVVDQTFAAELSVYLDWVPTVSEVEAHFQSQASIVNGGQLIFHPPTKISFKNAVS